LGRRTMRLLLTVIAIIYAIGVGVVFALCRVEALLTITF
jgi:hypothetical protein